MFDIDDYKCSMCGCSNESCRCEPEYPQDDMQDDFDMYNEDMSLCYACQNFTENGYMLNNIYKPICSFGNNDAGTIDRESQCKGFKKCICR